MNTSSAAFSSAFGTFINERRKALSALALGAAMTLASLGGIQPASAGTLLPAASTGGSGATAGVAVDAPVNLVVTSANGSFGPSAL